MICRPLCLSSLLTWAPVEKETGDLDFVGSLPNRDLWCTLSFFDDECIILKIRAPIGDRAGGICCQRSQSLSIGDAHDLVLVDMHIVVFVKLGNRGN